MTDTAEPTVDDTELRAELIAFELETAVEAERQRQRDAKERERLATKVTELEQRNASLTMAGAARAAGLSLEHQTARYFMGRLRRATRPRAHLAGLLPPGARPTRAGGSPPPAATTHEELT